MTEIDYESASYLASFVIAGAALSAAEGNYEDAQAVIENFDGPLQPVAFGCDSG